SRIVSRRPATSGGAERGCSRVPVTARLETRSGMSPAHWTAGITLAWACAGGPAVLFSQVTDSLRPPRQVRVAAATRYPVGPLPQLLLGQHYRDLWATPLSVDVLDFDTYAGGLKPTACGGRRQTKSIRLQGADGRSYVLRSVDKDPTLALPPDLR